MSDTKSKIIYFQLGFIIGVFLMIFLGGMGLLVLKSVAGTSSMGGGIKKLAGRLVNLNVGKGKQILDVNFEKQEHELFFKNDNGSEFQLSGQYPSDGKLSLKASFPGNQSYPGLAWEAYNVGGCFNWAGKQSLLFDVHNPEEKAQTLIVKIKSGVNGRKSFQTSVYLPSQETTAVKIPVDKISAQIDISQVSYITLFLDKPKQDVTLFFDHFRLE